MNRLELIGAIASKSGLTKKDAKAALEATLETIGETLAAGNQIAIVGFGTFSTSARAARTARVPGTDKTVDVPATTAIKFKAGKALKQIVAR